MWWQTLKASIIGIIIGIIPAAGPDIGAFLSYNEAKRASKTPEKFGKGSWEGILASETANNAVTGGSLIPLLTLSIPGSAPAALFLGALYIHGLRPGPSLFTTHADITYTMLVGFLIINFMMYFIGLAFCKGACKVVKTPRSVLVPLVIVLTVVGSYACSSSMFEVGVMFISGIIGYIMVKNNLPISPIALGLILGPILEQALQQSLIMFHGNLWLTLTRPIAIAFLLFAIVSLSYPFIAQWRKKRNNSGPGPVV
jgi:putative tricarboxylic transport membrane protein